MTGSGTKSDPYIIESWSEFKAISTFNYGYYSGLWYKVKSGSVWDMNELEPSGVCPSIKIETDGSYENSAGPKYIDGNGVVIKNLRLKDNPFFQISSRHRDYLKRFSNFVFENIYGQNNFILLDNYGISSGTTIEFNDCIFTGFFTVPFLRLSGDSGMANYRRLSFKRCGVNIDIMGINQFSERATYQFIDSYFKLKWYHNFSGTTMHHLLGDTNDSYAGNTWSIFNNSFVDIDLSNNVSNDSRLRIMTNSGSNSIFNIKMNKGKLNFYQGGSYNLFNRDLIGTGVYFRNGTSTNDVTIDSFSEYKPLTESQLKDPNYIRSIGFPIGGD